MTSGSTDQRPLIAVTMGDPAGVGPEITAKALANQKIRTACRAVVVGDLQTMKRTAGAVGLNVAATDLDALDRASADIQVYDPWGRDLSDVPVGTVDVRAGAAASRSRHRGDETRTQRPRGGNRHRPD